MLRVVVVVDMPAFYTADNDCYKKWTTNQYADHLLHIPYVQLAI